MHAELKCSYLVFYEVRMKLYLLITAYNNKQIPNFCIKAGTNDHNGVDGKRTVLDVFVDTLPVMGSFKFE